MGEHIGGRPTWRAVLARASGLATTSVVVLGVALAAGSMSAKRSQAQEPAHEEETSGFAFHAVEGGDFAGQSTQPPRITVKTIDADSFLAELDARGIELVEPRAGTESRSPIPTREEATLARREFVLDHSDALPQDALVDMIVVLRDVPFAELRTLKRMSADQRADVLAAREQEIHDAQASFAEHAIQHGARITQSMWLANHLRIKAHASEVESVLDHHDVVDVHVSLREGTADFDGYDGQEIRSQTFLQRFVDYGYDGEWGGRSNTQYGGDDIKVAVIEAWDSTGRNPDDIHAPPEPNWINDTHPGWQDWNGGPSRLRGNYFCDGPCIPAPSSSNASHGTIAAMIIAGDLTDNQDPNCEDAYGNPCGIAGEHQRTGVAREASILYFRTRFASDISSAIFQATVMGADIVNLSQSIANCDPPWNCPWFDCLADQNEGAMNEWIRTATDAGVLVVSSGGNRNNDMDNGVYVSRFPEEVACNLNYPAWRPEVVSVGGIGEVPNILNPLYPYDIEPIGDYSGRGWVRVGVGGWYSAYYSTLPMTAVTIVAPGVVNLHYTENDTYSDTSTHWDFGKPKQGNSWSVPVISGAAALLRQTTGVVDARALKAMIMVMGDGTDSRLSGTGYDAGPSEVYGAGRFKGHQFSRLESPSHALYNWSWHLEQDQELSLPFPSVPLSSSVTNWKWAAYIDQPDLTQVPWVTMEAVDACNGDALIGAVDLFFGLHKFVSFKAPVLEAGQCPKVRIYGLSVPDGGVDVYVAGYYHSGNPDEH